MFIWSLTYTSLVSGMQNRSIGDIFSFLETFRCLNYLFSILHVVVATVFRHEGKPKFHLSEILNLFYWFTYIFILFSIVLEEMYCRFFLFPDAIRKGWNPRWLAITYIPGEIKLYDIITKKSISSFSGSSMLYTNMFWKNFTVDFYYFSDVIRKQWNLRWPAVTYIPVVIKLYDIITKKKHLIFISCYTQTQVFEDFIQQQITRFPCSIVRVWLLVSPRFNVTLITTSSSKINAR